MEQVALREAIHIFCHATPPSTPNQSTDRNSLMLRIREAAHRSNQSHGLFSHDTPSNIVTPRACHGLGLFLLM